MRSLTKHLDDLNILLAKEQLHILCVGETWLNDSVDSRTLIFPGYKILRKDRQNGHNGGGLALIYRNELSVEQIWVPTVNSPVEFIGIEVTSRRPMIIGIIYRPPSSPTAAAIETIHDQLVYALTKNKPVYVLGDTNFDLLQPSKRGGSLLSDAARSIAEPTYLVPYPSRDKSKPD